MPIAYVEVVPVRADEFGRVTQIGSLLRVCDDGSIVERTLIAGRVLYHETIREAIARNISKDLGDIALPQLPQGLMPFTVAEFFPTPGVSPYHDARHCKPQDETLDVEWVDPRTAALDSFLEQMADGHDYIVRQALAWAGL